jgi:hypothetical protein
LPTATPARAVSDTKTNEWFGITFEPKGKRTMLLTVTSEHSPASDLGFLLHKHPDRFQTFDLSFGQAHVFYPEASADRCTACLLLDVDPVGMVRGKRREQGALLAQYVNDRPYVASSFMSVAISQVFSRLRTRSLGRKRSLALREFALGIEAMERFVRKEPLRRVHECVFGVLALESEPVDPRL